MKYCFYYEFKSLNGNNYGHFINFEDVLNINIIEQYLGDKLKYRIKFIRKNMDDLVLGIFNSREEAKEELLLIFTNTFNCEIVNTNNKLYTFKFPDNINPRISL